MGVAISATYVNLHTAAVVLEQCRGDAARHESALLEVVDALDTVDNFDKHSPQEIVDALGDRVLLHDISASVWNRERAAQLIRMVRSQS